MTSIENTPSNSNVPTIMHIDMDAFFVSVEQAINPKLYGKPIIVGGSTGERYGVVCSASYETRNYGVRSGMPLNEALRRCPQAITITPAHTHYIEYSHAIQNILLDFSPLVEMASVDEAYVDLSGTQRFHGKTPSGIADVIRNRIKQELNLPSSCGIATTRIVAKIASGCAKPNGRLWIMPGEERQFLRPLMIEKMPGIGPRCSEVLHGHGITTLGNIQDIQLQRGI